MIYFVIPLVNKTFPEPTAPNGTMKAYDKVKAEIGTSDRNVVFKDNTESIEIHLPYSGIYDKKFLPIWLRQVGIDTTNAEKMVETYGTNAYKQKLTRPDVLQTARDELRNVQDQAAPVIPNQLLAQDPKDALAGYLGSRGNNQSKGLCLGRSHGQKGSLDVLEKSIQNGDAEMLFLEEFTLQEQAALDDYLNGPDPVYSPKELLTLQNGTDEEKQKIEHEKLLPVLKEKVAVLGNHADGGEPLGLKWATVLREAKKKKTKIFAIDDGEARPFGGVDSEAATEQRDVMMNAVVKRVMDQKTQQFPNLKYVAVVGAAHSNTHRGGIPGVSQMYGIPAVRFNDTTGKITTDPEDQTLRGMPTKDEQIFIDRYLAEAEKKKGPSIPRSRKEIDEANFLLRKKATKNAASARATGTLPSYEEQLFLDTYEKKAAKAGVQGANNENIKYAAQRKLAQLKAPLAQQFAREIQTVCQQVNLFAQTQPPPPNLGAVQALLQRAEREGATGQLDGLQLALDKLNCITQMIQGQNPQPKTSVDLTDVVRQDNNVATDVGAAKKRVDDFAAIREAIEGKDNLGNPVPKNFAEAIRLIKLDPTLIDVVDDKGRNLLHYAAASANKGLLDVVLADCNPIPVDRIDLEGNTPLHLAVTDRLDMGGPTGGDTQKDCVDSLVGAGANVNVQNNDGSTPLHLAVMTNSTKVVKRLFDANANANLTDNRGWTPITTAIGATSVEVEKLFYSENKANPSVLGNAQAPRSTVDILCAATTCEDPRDLDRIRQSLTEMYANPTMRPALELAALHCAQPRNPPGGGGRLFISAGKGVSNLYKLPPGMTAPSIPPEGAYDEGGGVTLVASKSSKDFSGELAHELTHFVGHIVNNNQGQDTFPFDNDNDKTRYIDAIEADAKTLHQRVFTDMDSPEYKILERLSGRMNSYLGDPLSAKTELLKECIVSIPQLIAEFGEPIVRKYAGNLFAFYEDFSTNKCQEVSDSNRFAQQRLAIDNTPLANAQERDYPEFDTSHDWLPKTSSMLTWPDLEKKLTTEYAVRNGTKANGTIAFDPSLFKLDTNQDRTIKAKLAKIKKVMEKALGPNMLTTNVTTAGFAKLLKGIIDLVENAPDKDLEKLVKAKVDRWVLAEKVTFIRDKFDNNKPLDEQEFSEAVTLQSESLLMDTEEVSDFKVDVEKHMELVDGLKKSLGKLPQGRKFPSTSGGQFSLMEELSESVVGSKSKGVYQKGKTWYRRNPDPQLVSINTKNAKKKWVRILRNI